MMSRVHIISGANSLLGLEVCNALLDAGLPCILITRDSKGLNGLIKKGKKLVTVWHADLSKEDDILNICDKISAHVSNIWSFIHIAASSVEDNFEIDQMCKNFTVNVFSAWKISNSCIEKMKDSGGGRIIFVGSVGHKFGGKDTRPAYCSSKYLLEYFPRRFRECAKKNILINALRLGVMRGGTNQATGVSESTFKARIKLIPSNREIMRSEATRNILFLCSIENNSIHNTVLACTGGE